MVSKFTAKTFYRLPVLTALLLAVLSAAMLGVPTQAHALSTDSSTARSNEDGGSNVLGGIPARLSWEGTVDGDERVMQLTLSFPAGSAIAETSSVEVQEIVMDDPIHPVADNDVQYTELLTAESLTLVFSEGLRPNNKIIIQINGFIFPNADAEYIIAGAYLDDQGISHDLQDHDPISVVGGTAMQGFLNEMEQNPYVQWWNSDKFRYSFLDPVRALASVPNLAWGWLKSIGLVAAGFPLAIPFGLLIAFVRMSRFGILRFLSSIYVNVIRGTPLFLQIYIAFLGLPLFIPEMNTFVTGFVVLAINSSAYLAEIFRAGIQSISKGQFEASSSLGMNAAQTMFFVIIPQTMRRVIPTMTSEFILLFKDTSLLAAVGVMEMMMFAKVEANVGGNMTPYVVAALFYLIITLPLTRVISVFEKKLAATEGRTAPPDDKAKKPKTKRVGLFKTTAPISATASDPNIAISPEQHDSQ